MSDEFKTVTFRVDPGSRSASLDLSDTLHYGDSLKLVFTGVYGITPANAVAGFVSAGVSPSSFSSGGDDLSFVPGSKDAVYSTVTLDQTALKTAADLKAPGSPVSARVYMIEPGVKTWIDMAVDIYPSPLVDQVIPGTPPSAYVTASDLADALAAVVSMPTLTPAQREARVTAIIEALRSL